MICKLLKLAVLTSIISIAPAYVMAGIIYKKIFS